MPIPPRPVPRAHRRPGHSVPHKSASSSPAKISSNAAGLLDWRAEVAFLDSFAASKPHSMPSAGVVIMGAATRARDRERAAALAAQAQTGTAGAGAAETTEGSTGRREVGLEVLIADGRGKREKRASTAASLGYDFVHNPSVLVLPDTGPTSPPTTRSPPSGSPCSGGGASLLAISRPTPTRPSSPLSKTPQTPALLPSDARARPAHPGAVSELTAEAAEAGPGAEGDDESDLDEWEHVHLTPASEHGGQDQDQDREEMILGELELEDDLAGLSLIDKKEAMGMHRVDGLSYAAALRMRREQGQVM